ncbi:hypothetical protein [Suicoccus acidiformans]|uniref:hypothetical protein n=1 Tax=Suicoccus acidiformans TaxID=2036206 RepID=UPI0013C2BD07|nr:hypothetical protein [Suicoccus acidiformans]
MHMKVVNDQLKYDLEMENYRLHSQAWLNRAVQATDDKGKYIYRDFNKFYHELDFDQNNRNRPKTKQKQVNRNPELRRLMLEANK